MKVTFQWIFVVSFSLLFGLNAYAQSTINDFLLTAFEDRNTQEYSRKLDFLSKKNYQLPFGEELELRYSNDERTLDDARYQVRFRPTNPWKIRRNNALFNALKEEISLAQSIEFKENLSNRYSLMLDYIFAVQKTEIISKKLELTKRKIQFFEQFTQSDLFDAQDYVEAKLESIEVLDDYDDQLVTANQAMKEIQFILQSNKVEWRDFTLASVDIVEQIFGEVVQSSFSSVELDYLTQQVEVARLETYTEKADFDLGFVQAEYAPNLDNGKNELGFSFGFTIPIFKNNKDQLAERILDEIENENELEVEQFKDSLNKALEFSFLSDYIIHHRLLVDEIAKLDLEKLSVDLAQSEDFDPITLLELEEGKLKLDELVLRSHQRLMEHYLDFLFAFDALTDLPLRNYFANDLKQIE